MATQNTLQADILEMMKGHGKNTLWSVSEVMDEMEVERRAAENALYNLYKKQGQGKPGLFRHKDKSEDGELRYALYIPEKYREIYTPSKGRNLSGPRKKRLPNAKELRAMFGAAMNQMAALEDAMLAVVERQEELEKTTNKIKALID